MGDLLEGRVAIVTGAGRGIGAGVARLLAREGAKVVVNDLGVALDGTGEDQTPAQQVVEQIRGTGGEATVNADDVADHHAAQAIVNQAIDTYGRLDVLVNVAGILRDRMVFNMSEEDWDAVIRVHLKGTFNTAHYAAGYWRSRARHRWPLPADQLHVGLRAARCARSAQLRGGEDGHRWLHLLVCERPAALRGDGERHLPRCRHPDDRVGARRAAPYPDR